VTRSRRLTVAEERELVIATEAGDPEACRRLVETFLPEINGVARPFRNAVGVEPRDLLQEGVAALLFAARRYDQRLETPFWAYAAFWVRKAMQELVADLSRAVALSDRAVRGLATVRAARADFQRAHGREPSTDDLAELTGFTREQVERLLAADRVPRSLEARIRPDDETAGTVGDRIADPAAEKALEAVLDGLELRRVEAVAGTLTDRELDVLRSHYGLGEPARSLGQIGAVLGVSAERARQIEAAALRKLRDELTRPVVLEEAT